MMSRKKRLGLCREVLRSQGFVFDQLPPSWRQTLESAAESAEIDARRKKVPISPKWEIEKMWGGLQKCGLAKVVQHTIDYFFAGTVLSSVEFDELLLIAKKAEEDGLVVRAVVEEAWRKKITERISE